MANGPATRISDVIVPEIFTPYSQLITQEKSRLVQSAALVRSPELDTLLAGGGLTFQTPMWKDLDDDPERVSTDTPSDRYSNGDGTTYNNPHDPDPFKTGSLKTTSVRLSRNASWSTAKLAAVLAGADPADSIANRVGEYWTRRLQKLFIATMNGVFADNAAAPTGGDTHTQNDMTFNVSGSSFTDGVTNFSAEAFIDACLTMGDSMESLGMIAVHSIVYGRMMKNNLIDFIPDSRGEVNIPTFLGRVVVVDDAMPVTGGVFESWLFGSGAVGLGVGSPEVPTEVERHPGAGNGAGQEVLWNRVEWCIAPAGYSYIGTPASGGPDNSNTTNNLANAGSWSRRWTERKQIKIARLITREF